ncbi:hypothetical protein SJAG_00556 [Schizosaccharomyces japonicus yFS275]|uniref:Uncharacterized protein n=1 Tax=Schizosaccharomyces japonicus (strain yFS275 / FY16936) TaxID=402676 RepID=B6JVZ1_SCHJY|nr:hypothetical protein SJAG_00556 [Schizosaccharomyces japonicus yFS275]EEB05542.1 hypothetical protein SJAG_00556 [Schizosaccharomyces japonicus yFS275]
MPKTPCLPKEPETTTVCCFPISWRRLFSREPQSTIPIVRIQEATPRNSSSSSNPPHTPGGNVQQPLERHGKASVNMNRG